MYTVIFYRDYASPNELKNWLDDMYRNDGLELVTADGGYFIFKKREDAENDD